MLFDAAWVNYCGVLQGHGTTVGYPNPGRTAGLRGRKRDLTEGGIRIPGLQRNQQNVTLVY